MGGCTRALRIGRIFVEANEEMQRRKGRVVGVSCVCFTSGNWKLQDE